jgi:hypothetical protein
MYHRAIVAMAVSISIFCTAASAQITPVVARLDPAHASADFKLPGVPVPSANDAAAGRKFVIVDGNQDENGGNAEVLTDGRVPDGQDDPQDNFFFASGTDGGRLRLDLGSVIDVRQVNSYSWHANTRAPQVYKLYAPQGRAENFNVAPPRGVDPASCGWKLLASVDTRLANGNAGGEYGVSIGDGTKVIAHCGSLLFDVFATEHDDSFGNTFYSEIDVIGGDEMLKPAAAVAPDTQFTFGLHSEYRVAIDTREAPQLKTWADHLEPVIREWYPKLVMSLPSDGYVPTPKFRIVFNNKPGVAYTSGTVIVCSAKWFTEHPDDQGALVHEMVHMAQQYRRGGNPSWLVEGIADYFRWFVYEPPSMQPHPNLSTAHYTDSYRTTAAFLNYVVQNVDKDLVVQMNTAMREGKYSADLWKHYTGKTADELWNGYVNSALPQAGKN